MGIYRGRGFPARFTYRHYLWAHLRGHRNSWHGVCSQMHWHPFRIICMTIISMGISHWQYAWSFYSCVYLADIYLVDIFTGNCHFWHIFRALCILTFCAGIVLEHSFLTLSNVACPSDMYNLDIFPGHIFFGHISRTINFLDMFHENKFSGHVSRSAIRKNATSSCFLTSAAIPAGSFACGMHPADCSIPIPNTKYRAPVYLFPRHYSSSFRPLYFFSHSKFLFNSIVIYQNDLYNYP